MMFSHLVILKLCSVMFTTTRLQFPYRRGQIISILPLTIVFIIEIILFIYFGDSYGLYIQIPEAWVMQGWIFWNVYSVLTGIFRIKKLLIYTILLVVYRVGIYGYL